MKPHNVLAAFGVVLLSLFSANAADPTPSPSPVEMKVTKAYTYDGDMAHIRGRLIVEVDKLYEAIQQDKINPRDFVLYLDGRALTGVNASPIEAPRANKLLFEMKRTDESREAWTTLLGRPASDTKQVAVSIGLPNQAALTSDVKIPFRIYSRGWAWFSFFLLVLALIGFFWLARKGYLVHDSHPLKAPVPLKPYSLALSQAAFWFFLVIGSFLLIYLITGDYNTITEQALILIGIGTGTALGSAMIQATKTDTSQMELSSLRPERARLEALRQELGKKKNDLDARLKTPGIAPSAEDKLALSQTIVALEENTAKLAEVDKSIVDAESRLSKPESENFLMDILTDVNGITLHRFQIVLWTLILGMLFIRAVYQELAMPQFSPTLLALLGISSGTYLGFKIPERQS